MKYLSNSSKLLSIGLLLLVAMHHLTGCRTGRTGRTGKDSVAVQPADSVTSAKLMVSAMYIDASKEKILGNFSRAIDLLDQVLKQNPKHHPSYFQLADIHHIGGDYASALYYIEKAISLDGDNVWYQVLHGDLLLKAGRYRDAVVVYREVIRQQPTRRIWHEALAHAQRMGGQGMAAADTYREILDEFGFDEEIFLKMLDIYESAGRHRRVEQSLQWLIESYPFETRYLGALAAFYYHRGQPDKALPLWQEILRLEPRNGEVRFDLANYYRSKGDDERAYRELYEAFKSPNLSIDAKVVVMTSYYHVTEKYPQLLEEAYNLLDMMVDRHPENPKGWSVYADFLYRDGRYREALEQFQRVVALDSTKYLVWEQLLRCAWLVYDFDALRTQGARALSIFPEQSLLYLFHGMGQLYGNNLSGALVTFEQGRFFVVMNDTLEYELQHAMARAMELSGRPAQAREIYRKTLRQGLLKPYMVADHYRYAVLWSDAEHLENLRMSPAVRNALTPSLHAVCQVWINLAGNRERGADQIQQLVSQYPEHYLVMEHVADMYHHLEKGVETEKAREKARDLSNGNNLWP